MKQSSSDPVLSIPKKKKKKGAGPLPFLLLVPTFVLLAVFTFYPFLKAIYLTFFVTDKVGNPGTFVGLDNYKRILASEAFRNSLLVTFKYAGLIAVGTFTLAMVLAYLCVEKSRRGKIYQTMFSLPIALATAPVAAIFEYIFGRYGMINGILGTQNAWITDARFALGTMVLIVMWANCGSSFIYLLVGFRNVPDELIECANLDGAGPLTKFFKIYIPIASPQIFFVVFLNILTSFKSFAMIKILLGNTNSALDVLIFQVYKQAFIRGRFETACVYAAVLCLIIFLTTRIQMMVEKRVVNYQ